jgi:acyl carrier protein
VTILENLLNILKKSASLEVQHSALDQLSLHLISDFNLDSLELISFIFEVERVYGVELPQDLIDSHELLNLVNLARHLEDT